ncbi:MAG: carbohydrate kinase family protein [Clostridia bacterium]|nr:carbohydrate kinase family protein [Clostridia bacterium]
MNKRFDLICVGMALLDSIIKGFDPQPISASGYRAASGTLNVGGEAVNEAVTGAKLGLKTGIVCALGADEAGEMVRNTLRRSGVDVSRIVRGESTPVTTMFVHADGTRKSITNEAHRFNFHPENDPAAFTDASALILGSLFRAPFDDPAIIHAVLKAAKEAGQIVLADTKLPNFRFLKLDDLRDSLPLIDYLTPNEDEARYFTGKTEPEDMADALLSWGVKHAVIKLGAKGCLMKTKEKTVTLPAYAIHAVDATGAGDNFAAGFVSELLRGKPAEEALSFANACGALCATAVGAGTALQSRDQVLRFMADTPFMR